MITLTATIEIKGKVPTPLVLGSTALGGNSAFGEEISFVHEVTASDILSLDSDLVERSDLKMPSWGIISNKGNLSFNDHNKRFLGYANQGILVDGFVVTVKLKNTLVKGAEKIVARLQTDTWDYDNDNRSITVSIKDDLEEWQDINVTGISYDPRNPMKKPFSWLYGYLWEITYKNYNIIPFAQLDSSTRDILEHTYIQYPMLEAGSLWAEWDKLCQVCQLHIYKDNNGVVVCRYNGGN